ncbi:hypothetical protein GUJ93_ZPchr0465g6471 [Zizania palustris]|uniref:Uncharacterized protein n=1 Tax=Zizania palustris TaxID=103762 RepID=A0A8J5RCV2_ZIZPA|nr:hypothetical protein GUJ93_ZPchr0465g6471 [Zizania palustris]
MKSRMTPPTAARSRVSCGGRAYVGAMMPVAGDAREEARSTTHVRDQQAPGFPTEIDANAMLIAWVLDR